MLHLRNFTKSFLDYYQFIISLRGDNLLAYLGSDTVKLLLSLNFVKKKFLLQKIIAYNSSWCYFELDDDLYLLSYQEEYSVTSNQYYICCITKELLEYITEDLIIWQAYETH